MVKISRVEVMTDEELLDKVGIKKTAVEYH